MSKMDINGQIILKDGSVKKEIFSEYTIKETEENILSLHGFCNFNSEKELIKDIIEKTSVLNIFSGIIEIRNDKHFFIMFFNILKDKWDIQKQDFI